MQILINAGASSTVTAKTVVFDLASIVSGDYTGLTNGILKADGVVISDTENATGSGTSATFTFDSLDYEIAAGEQTTFAFYSDLSSSLTATAGFTINLDYSDSLFEDSQGDEITEASDGDNDVTSPALDIISGGLLTVTVDGDTPDNAILTGNSTGNEVARFRLSAAYDAIEVTDLYLANNFTDSSDDSPETGTDANISALKIYVDGELVDSRALSSGLVHYGPLGNDSITVPKNSSKVVVVKADLNDVNAVSKTNKRLLIELYSLKAVSGATGTALGSATGVANVTGAATGIDDGKRAEELIIVRDAPTVSTVSLSSTLTNGTYNNIYSFNVSANDSIGVKKILFDVTGVVTSSMTAIADLESVITFTGEATDVTTGVKIYRGSTELTSRATINITANNVISVVFDDNYEQAISSTAKTYTLKANLTGFTGGTNTGTGNSITTKIKEVTTSYAAAKTYTAAVTAASTGTFIWGDNSGIVDNNASQVYWMNERYLNGLETTGVTLSL